MFQRSALIIEARSALLSLSREKTLGACRPSRASSPLCAILSRFAQREA